MFENSITVEGTEKNLEGKFITRSLTFFSRYTGIPFTAQVPVCNFLISKNETNSSDENKEKDQIFYGYSQYYLDIDLVRDYFNFNREENQADQYYFTDDERNMAELAIRSAVSWATNEGIISDKDKLSVLEKFQELYPKSWPTLEDVLEINSRRLNINENEEESEEESGEDVENLKNLLKKLTKDELIKVYLKMISEVSNALSKEPFENLLSNFFSNIKYLRR